MRIRRGTGRLHNRVLHRVLVWICMTVFVAGVYVVVVRGGGAVIGRTDSPSVALSVLATATVALSFVRVQTGAERWASRLLGDRSAEPYEVLSRFSESVPEDDSTDDLPARMARLLAEGTGARWAQV